MLKNIKRVFYGLFKKTLELCYSMALAFYRFANFCKSKSNLIFGGSYVKRYLERYSALAFYGNSFFLKYCCSINSKVILGGSL